MVPSISSTELSRHLVRLTEKKNSLHLHPLSMEVHLRPFLVMS